MTTPRRRALFGLALAALLVGAAAEAHHGWRSYNTELPLYFEGTVAEVQWRNPHPELVVVVASPGPTVNPGNVPLRADAESAELKEALAKAKPAAPGRYTVHLPPIARLERAGISAPPKPGERFIAIAFASCAEAGTARATFVAFANGTSATQQIAQATSTCPARS